MTEAGRDFEVTVVSDPQRTPTPPPVRHWSVDRDPRAYAKATLTVIVASLLALSADRIFPVTSLSLIFMTGVIVVAVHQGLWPSLYASCLSFLTYNFFFTDPRNTFLVIRQDQIMTLLLFLTFYVPCLSTFAVMLRTLGPRQALQSVGISLAAAMAIAGMARLAMQAAVRLA